MTATGAEPGTIEPPAGAIPYLRMPKRTLFETRAMRLAALAEGHALGDYLRFVAALACAQHAALARMHAVPLPDTAQLARCREHGLPPLGVEGWTRDPSWRAALRHILAALETQIMPEAARATIMRLRELDDAGLEGMAGELLGGGHPPHLDHAAAPFVAAALQVYWTHMAAGLGACSIGRLRTPGLCPVCGLPPVSSIVRIGAAEHRLRYLSCCLCSAEWHVVRIKCAFCETTKGISYYGIEGGNGMVKAEHCDACKSYLKILYVEKDPDADVVADDIASLGLDILMAESDVGRRGGVNFFLLGGNA